VRRPSLLFALQCCAAALLLPRAPVRCASKASLLRAEGKSGAARRKWRP
jgi:hypothetical protein